MIAPEVRLDMSLDDVIKANKKAVSAANKAKPNAKDGKKKKGTVAAAPKGKAGLGATPRPNAPGTPSSGKKLKKLKLKKINNGSPGAVSVASNQSKSIKSVGFAKAKRAAKANQVTSPSLSSIKFKLINNLNLSYLLETWHQYYWTSVEKGYC